MVSADTINTFKNRLDKFWSDQEVLYDYNTDLHGICHFTSISRIQRPLRPASVFSMMMMMTLRYGVSYFYCKSAFTLLFLCSGFRPLSLYFIILRIDIGKNYGISVILRQ